MEVKAEDIRGTDPDDLEIANPIDDREHEMRLAMGHHWRRVVCPFITIMTVVFAALAGYQIDKKGWGYGWLLFAPAVGTVIITVICCTKERSNPMQVMATRL
jgi:peptidoglycan/LPS O-acetylase OafA/YrhL